MDCTDRENVKEKIIMMRPMKLAGSELMFGAGSLEYIKTIKARRVIIVTGGSSMEKNGVLGKIEGYFSSTGAVTGVIKGVEPDPTFQTVMRGTTEMLDFEPDLIVGLGGGSAMDAAKAMWVFYEHPELKSIEELITLKEFPKLRKKARLCCIPSTSGTASEVSRSIVISDNETGMKHGLGNMEMMPDIAICDPDVTVSMPSKITAETGMDALTHALEALVSKRANYISDLLATQAALDIITYLPRAYRDGSDIEAREKMLLASMTAGMAFTNVSLGIVHSMAHTIGSFFHVAHGLADAVLLPHIIGFNSADRRSQRIYRQLAGKAGVNDLERGVIELNQILDIPEGFAGVISDRETYMNRIPEMAETALADGCTKTNPIIPSISEIEELFRNVYKGE